MVLYHQDFGGTSDSPIVLIHGLLGSSRNWVTVGKLLAENYRVIALDLRNHGQSQHSDEMDYECMEADVEETLDQLGFNKVQLVGHSMGGKVSMRFAINHPEKTKSLCIVDIAAKDYPPHHADAFTAMKAIDPTESKRIQEVDQQLAQHLDDPILRQFLLTNLKRSEDGTLQWQINLGGIDKALPELSRVPFSSEDQFLGDCLLIRGATSNFVKEGDFERMKTCFPTLQLEMIDGAGHNVHIDKRFEFVDSVTKFLG